MALNNKHEVIQGAMFKKLKLKLNFFKFPSKTKLKKKKTDARC
jgi:hypothetical protein